MMRSHVSAPSLSPLLRIRSSIIRARSGCITVKPDEEIRCSLNVEVWGGHA
jgi:hypothetical protein